MKIFCILGSIVYAFIVVIAGRFCRMTSMPASPAVHTSESLARLAVKDGGGQWVGIQEAEGMPYDLILFNSPTTGSTLALKSHVGCEITADKVRQRIKDSDILFKGN